MAQPKEVGIRKVDKEKGERIRTEEEMEEVRKEYEKFDAALFFDPRKIACFQTAFFSGAAIGATGALFHRFYRMKYWNTFAALKNPIVGLFSFVLGSSVAWVSCRVARENRRLEELQWVEFQRRREQLMASTGGKDAPQQQQQKE